MRQYWPLLIPVIAFMACAGLLVFVYRITPVHIETDMLRAPTFSRTMILIAGVILFQFQWIETAIICAGSALLLMRIRRDPALRTSPVVRMLWFLSLLYVAGIALLIFRVPFNNIRYVMPLAPVGILLFAGHLSLLNWKPWLKTGILTMAALLQLSALTRSNDPVSRLVYGTFPFGDHRLYSMAAAAEDPCCGEGRDQLAYNLEYQRLRTVTELAMKTVKPTDGTILVAHRKMFIDKPDRYWGSFPRGVNPVTYRFTEDDEALHPVFINAESLMEQNALPRQLFYFEFPNVNNDEAKQSLLTRYRIDDTVLIEEDGYRMEILRMNLRYK